MTSIHGGQRSRPTARRGTITSGTLALLALVASPAMAQQPLAVRVAALKDGAHPTLGRLRYNLTFRKAL